jgi:hypothetical protein
MAAARTAASGLSTVDLENIRDTLAAGRKPKVMFTEAAGQIAGQLGQVVELTDPELSDEWVVVRFGKDELPFSPTDLIIAPKSTATRRTSTTPVPAPREETPVTPPAPSIVDVEIPAPPAPAKGAAANGASANGAASKDAAKDAVKDMAKDAVKDAAKDSVNGSAIAAAEAKRPVPAKKAAKPKAPAELTITINYGEGEWMISATQGAKTIAKPYLIKPAEALKLVSLLDAPMVQEAVDDIVNAARQEAEDHAEKLRAQLAEIEARLAELRDAG